LLPGNRRRLQEAWEKERPNRERVLREGREKWNARTFKPWPGWVRPFVYTLDVVVFLLSFVLIFESDTPDGSTYGFCFLVISVVFAVWQKYAYRHVHTHIDPKYLSKSPD
jgi:hypothetical protein